MKSKDQKRREAIERRKANIAKYAANPTLPHAIRKIEIHERDIRNTERKLLY